MARMSSRAGVCTGCFLPVPFIRRRIEKQPIQIGIVREREQDVLRYTDKYQGAVRGRPNRGRSDSEGLCV